MAAFPGSNVHRPSRRQLSKGQAVQHADAVAAVTASGSVATITSNVPLVVRGPLPLSVSGGPTFVSQVVVSPTVVQLTFSAALAGHAWTLDGGSANASTFQGGGLAAASGTF